MMSLLAAASITASIWPLTPGLLKMRITGGLDRAFGGDLLVRGTSGDEPQCLNFPVR